MSSSARLIRRVNLIVNRPSGGGSKLQGTPSSGVGLNPNLVSHVRIKGWGRDRNVVFYVNQLGGVGRKRTQFLSDADGVNRP